ncbi:MAG TPA: heparinase II/III family protein, partial [Pyrinomonadaceae bacterium]|nr:heparinase II/III family protein [Pyrinomonadaceae bacterium]
MEKLRRASLQELRVRAAQRVAAFSERRGWSTLVKLPSDHVFGHSTHDLLEHFRSRSEPAFFASFKTPEQTAAEFKLRWPGTAQRLIEKADRICDGKFDLLGFKNLDFGNPIDWHYEPLSEKRIPLEHWSKLDFLDAALAGDKKITWELNRHQYFMTLGQAFLLTGDERYVRVFTAHIDAWMGANPPKLGINWASSLEVAFRSMSWLWAFYFFKSSQSLSPETFKRAWKFLYLSARHLESYLSTYFSPNTHLTGEALGLFYLGTLLPEFREAKRWQELGRQILIEQLPIHVKPDGVYFEQSSYYHRYTTDFYIHFLLLSRANKVALPPAVEETLVLLLDHLMYITRPDGTTPFFGDDDGGR